jgi:iron complex transport system substrate-binding protein
MPVSLVSTRLSPLRGLSGCAAGLLIGVAGCSSSGSASQSPPSSSAASSASVAASDDALAAAAFPVTVQHKFGSTTIPTAPQRVVTIGFNEQDFALALGVTPVAVREFFGYDYKNRPWAKQQLAGAGLPEVGGQELKLEAVAAQNPDLILGTYSFIDKPIYDQLSEIAPTVADLATGAGVSSASWQEQLAVDAAALGKTAEGAQLTAEVEAKFSAAAADHPDFAGKKLAVVFATPETYYVLEPEDLRARFFADLGFAAPPTVGEVTFEQAALLDQDVLVVIGATKNDFLAANPLAGTLSAVTEERTAYFGDFTEDFPAALGFGSPLSLPFALDVAVPRLAAAADGDPATVGQVD